MYVILVIPPLDDAVDLDDVWVLDLSVKVSLTKDESVMVKVAGGADEALDGVSPACPAPSVELVGEKDDAEGPYLDELDDSDMRCGSMDG